MLLTRKKLKPKYGRSSIIKPVLIHGIDGIDGLHGLNGIKGENGLQGEQGVEGKRGEKGLSVKGEPGKKGAKGQPGLAGRGIKSVDMFSRIMRINYTDGTSEDIDIKRPAGTVSNPSYGTGGMEPPVKDIRGGTDIEVLEKNGIYTINFTGEAEDFMDAEDKANLATTADKLTELVTVQHEQLLRVERELKYIKTHANIITGEKITDQDIEKDEQ